VTAQQEYRFALLRIRYEWKIRAEARQLWEQFVRDYGRLGARVSEELLYQERLEGDAHYDDRFGYHG